MRFRGRQNKYDMSRRFFERFEQGVESLAGKHMGFVDNIDLVCKLGRSGCHRVAQGPDLVDPTIAGGIDFGNIHIGG